MGVGVNTDQLAEYYSGYNDYKKRAASEGRDAGPGGYQDWKSGLAQTDASLKEAADARKAQAGRASTVLNGGGAAGLGGTDDPTDPNVRARKSRATMADGTADPYDPTKQVSIARKTLMGSG